MALITGTPAADTLPLTNGDTVFGAAGHDTFVFDPSGASSFTTIGDFGAIYFGGPVTGAQETTPPGGTGSAASGTVQAYLIRGGSALVFTSTVTGLDFTGNQTPANPNDNVAAAHFHDAPAGSSGGVVFGFIGAPFNDLDGDVVVTPGPGVGGTVRGEWDANEGNAGATLTSKIPDLLNDEIYINFHTPAFPAGEIRGQLIQQDEGLDRIDVTAANIGDWETMQALLQDVGGSAQFTVWSGGRSHTVSLSRVPEAALLASDFIFETAVVDEALEGGSRRDDLFGAGGDDTLDGGANTDRLFGEAGDDDLDGGSGGDTVSGGAGHDEADGDSGADSVSGGDGNDTVEGGSGDDTLSGGNGNDWANGDSGDDTVAGGEGTDTLLGGSDNDTLDGGNANDWIEGDSGDDWILGGGGNDQLFGDSGDDTLNGGAGNDTLDGGSGDNAFVAGLGADLVVGFDVDDDRVLIATGTSFTVNEVGGNAVVDFGGGNTLTLQGVDPDDLPAGWFVLI